PAISSSISVPGTFLWKVDDGTIVSGTDTSVTMTATFPAGFRYVHLTAVAGNGTSHDCHIPVFARDPANDLTLKHQITRHQIGHDGSEFSFRVLQDLDRTLWPDGSLVMMWDKEPVAPADRTHMKFIGWEQSNDGAVTSSRTATLAGTGIHCLGVAGRLKTPAR